MAMPNTPRNVFFICRLSVSASDGTASLRNSAPAGEPCTLQRTTDSFDRPALDKFCRTEGLWCCKSAQCGQGWRRPRPPGKLCAEGRSEATPSLRCAPRSRALASCMLFSRSRASAACARFMVWGLQTLGLPPTRVAGPMTGPGAGLNGNQVLVKHTARMEPHCEAARHGNDLPWRGNKLPPGHCVASVIHPSHSHS